ncbi:MAG: nitrile hydratase subunit beta [Salinisphaera sp.]|nr:nitrile hydratase subunit beta [Salinisphaera sp.]
MNGIHDMGGMHGIDPIHRQADEPQFHYDWERRVMGMFPAVAAAGLISNVDEFRHAIERMSPVEYLEGTYYEHWLHAFETLLVEKGVITREELASGKAASGKTAEPVLTPELVEPALKAGLSAARPDADSKPRFKVGDRVRTVKKNPQGHTRLPRYTRGQVGRIEIDHGVFVTPDTVAHGQGEQPQHVYTVSFSAADLWGAQASANNLVHADLWDDYLEAA